MRPVLSGLDIGHGSCGLALDKTVLFTSLAVFLVQWSMISLLLFLLLICVDLMM